MTAECEPTASSAAAAATSSNNVVVADIATMKPPPPPNKHEFINSKQDSTQASAKANQADSAETPSSTRGNSHKAREARYYVPINVAWRQRRLDPEDGNKSNDSSNSGSSSPPLNQVSVQSIAWTFVEAVEDCDEDGSVEDDSAGGESKRPPRNTFSADIDQENVNESLAAAIKKLDESIGQAKCLFVSCGPLPLRQYLHPAALRAGLKLASHYNEYVDLSKEFTRRYGHVAASSSPTSAATGQQPAASISHNQLRYEQHYPSQQRCFEGSSGDQAGQCYCCDYYAAAAAYCNAQQQHKQQATVDFYSKAASQFAVQQQSFIAEAPSDSAENESPATTSSSPSTDFSSIQQYLQQQQHQQQHQQLQQTSRIGLRVEQMLKFLSIESHHLPPAAAAAVEVKEGLKDGRQEAGEETPAPRKSENTTQAKIHDAGASDDDGYSSELQRVNADEGCHQLQQQQPPLDGCRLVESMAMLIRRMLSDGHQLNRIERIKRRVEVGLCDNESQDGEQRVIKTRGLPWQASEQDIADFFVGLNIAKGGVGLCLSRQGRRNGEAMILFESREHRNLALGRHKQFMGSRYIEVYRGSAEDFLNVATGKFPDSN